ncbi:hypothetical protein EV702DRAFT_1049591 [Suillus placidus]|uniref:Uncharacterized protein n=1 Tax=Suillus placidus TaxID=48579 RepID=A0A9P6ZK31_9AGAM|nr:hypothetical protein EV702DRAFT_1049591 [Suillus placidus]
MASVPADWALHTTCIASDYVLQLFKCNVGGNQQSISPPLVLDVPTMLACRQLARVLADAYSNPNAISPWIQAEMEEATIGMGYLLKKSMTKGLQTKWRMIPGYFHASNQAPCWFQQGQELYGFPPSDGFFPEVSATLKGEGGLEAIISMQRSALLALVALWVMHPKLYWASVTTQIKLAQWAMAHGLSDMCACLQFWALVFNCAAVICNRQCPLHRDPRSTPEGFDIMTSVSNYCDGLMTLSNLGIELQYNSGTMVGCTGHIVRHGVTYTSDRIVWAWFMRDSIHNFVGTPWQQYATYMDVDWDVSVSA